MLVLGAIAYAVPQGVLWLITLKGEIERSNANKFSDASVLYLPAVLSGIVGITAWLHLVVPTMTVEMLNSPGKDLMRIVSEPASVINILHANPLEGFPAFIAMITCLLGIFVTMTDTTHYLSASIRKGMWAALIALSIITISMGIEIILSPKLWIIGISIVVIGFASSVAADS